MADGRRKVLWVDDEIEFLRSHIMFLETRGYSVTPVFSGDDAIHILNKDPFAFDIVLLDEQMPGKDGLTTLSEIKQMNRDLPVVMVTKSEEETLMDDAIGLKIDGYLTKPVNPSQILLICKKLLHSSEIVSTKLKQDYLRNYTTWREKLHYTIGHEDWIKFYRNFSYWDIKIAGIQEESIRQAHEGQKFDADALFSNYYSANYYKWMKKDAVQPLFSPNVLKTIAKPHLDSGEKVCVIAIDALRLDHFIKIYSLLTPLFKVEEKYCFSIIPSVSQFTKYALLSGKFPSDISKKWPEFWQDIVDEKDDLEKIGSTMLKSHADDLGLKSTEVINTVIDCDDKNSVSDIMKLFNKHSLVTVCAKFHNLFFGSGPTDKILKHMASGETAFRKLFLSWFELSSIYTLLMALSEKKITVLFTTGNGSNFCTRGTEGYGDNTVLSNLRYRFGSNITCDERYALYVHEPRAFKLPQRNDDDQFVILRENYYFIKHDVYKNYNKQYFNTFQNGGISMAECIIPCAVLTSKPAFE